MPRRTLGSLGTLVREKRGSRKLREVAREIGIGAATLMRVENGRIPDVSTFGKLCNWLVVDPGSFLGYEEGNAKSVASEQGGSEQLVAAHLRVDQLPQAETAQALAKMILLAARTQPAVEEVPGNVDV